MKVGIVKMTNGMAFFFPFSFVFFSSFFFFFFFDFLDGASLVIDHPKKDFPFMGNMFVENLFSKL